RTANIGIMPPEVAISYGVGGPNLRGSGVRWDLRKEEPYCVYDHVDFNVPVGTSEFGPVGSTWDRYMVRVREMLEALRIIRQVVEQMPRGDPNEAMPRRVRPPEGDAYLRTESPRGEIGFYIITDGSRKPYRGKGRSPAFAAIIASSAISKAAPVGDAGAIGGGLDIVRGEV